MSSDHVGPLRTWAAVVSAAVTALPGAFASAEPVSVFTTRVGAMYSTAESVLSVDIDLRDVVPVPAWRPGDAIREVPRRHGVDKLAREQVGPRGSMPVGLTATAEAPVFLPVSITDGINVAGQGFTGSNPPDPVGDVGPSFYIQAVNGLPSVQYTVYSKSTGTALAGPFLLQALTGELGGGDPIVLYDHLAGRWLLSEFDSSENKLHVAISRSADPISGGWFVYAFTTPYFPDYPKYGVWPDGYYVTANEESAPKRRPAYYVMERSRMLAGDSDAGIQRFELPALSGYGFQSVMPCDLDGRAPPEGARHVALRHNDDEAHDELSSDPSRDFLDVFEFHVDWADPGNSFVTGPSLVDIGEFDSHLGGYNVYGVVPQPGTTEKLDPVQQPTMWRLQYRNHGTHESLVGCFTVDLTGGDLASIRWFELRGGAGHWSLFQEGTLTNGLGDGVHRWMGSIAADVEGNIALAYSASSSSVYPGLRYVGRRAGDPRGLMTLPERMLVSGGASQTGVYANRFGDYSSLNVDPIEECTFWYTGQYHASANWSTRIASFSFGACGCDLPAPSTLTAIPGGTNRIDLAWDAASDDVEYNIYRRIGNRPGQIYRLFAGGVAASAYSDGTVSGGVPYSYVVRSYNPLRNCESTDSGCADAVAGGACFEPPEFSGLQSVDVVVGEVCALRLTWARGISVCGGGEIVYHVYRSTDSEFVPVPENRVASCLTGTSYVDRTVSHNVTYTYIVRAEDAAGMGLGPCMWGSQDANLIRRSGTPSGSIDNFLTDRMESGPTQWAQTVLPGDVARYGWELVTTASLSPTHAWFCRDESRIKDRALRLATPVCIPATPMAALRFAHMYDTEFYLDGGVLEYSTDGTNWFDILEGNGVGVPANSNRIVSGGYNSVMVGTWGSPIAGRKAWSGDSGGFVHTEVDLSDMTGASLDLRWRFTCDSSEAADGWWIDDVTIDAAVACETGGYESWRAGIQWVGGGGADEDDNGDGINNRAAYFFGVNPTGDVSEAQRARLPSISRAGSNEFTYGFSRSTGDVVAATHRVRTTTNLLDGVWELIIPTSEAGTDGRLDIDVSGEVENRRFFRFEIAE